MKSGKTKYNNNYAQFASSASNLNELHVFQMHCAEATVNTATDAKMTKIVASKGHIASQPRKRASADQSFT